MESNLCFVRVPSRWVVSMLTQSDPGVSTRVIRGLPKGSKLLRYHVDQRAISLGVDFILIFEHPSFPEIKDGMPIPELPIELWQDRVEGVA